MNTLTVSDNSNIRPTAVNEIRLDFAHQPLQLSNMEVALHSLGLYVSWRNITAAYNNNAFSYIYNGTEYPVNIPDGFYLIPDINRYMQLVMYNNGHYMLNASGKAVYFIDFKANPTYYTITFTMTPIEVPTGGTNPNSLIPGSTMQIKFPDTPIKTLLGVNPGTYPTVPSTTFYNFNSQSQPIISPVTKVIVTSNCSQNKMNKYSDEIFSFYPSVNYASYQAIEPNYPVFYRCYDGTYNEISVQFYDQQHRPLILIDRSQITATLLFRERV